MKTPEEIKTGLECCEKYLNGAPEEECCHVCNYIYNCAELMLDAIAYTRNLESRAPGWISVEERLPEHGKYVLCWYSDIDGDEWHTVGEVMDDGRWRVDIYEIDEQEYYTVTHWMPLPEAPKED